MEPLLAVYGSPRRKGNTAVLLDRAVQGVRDSGCSVEEVFLGDLNLSPCLELYGCKKNGRCVIQDDFQDLYDKLVNYSALLLASPIFFYSLSAQTKILLDRCQSLWVKKYWIEKVPFRGREPSRKGLFISAGASQGKRLFEGALLSVRYFFDVLDMALWKTLLYRGLDFEGDVLQYPSYLEEAYRTGLDLAQSLQTP